MSRFQHIIWDWNGTLLDDSWLCRETLNHLLGKRAMPPVSLQDYRDQFEFPVLAYYHKLGFDLEREPFEDLSNEYIDHYNSQRLRARLQPGLPDALERLQRAGLEQSILSAYKHDTLVELVQHYGLETFFAHIAGAADNYAGSKEEAGKDLLHTTGATPAQTLLIGDTLHDAEVASSLGAQCLLLTCGHMAPTRLAAAGCPMADTPEAAVNWILSAT